MNKINNNHQQIFQKITQQFENSVCFECGKTMIFKKYYLVNNYIKF